MNVRRLQDNGRFDQLSKDSKQVTERSAPIAVPGQNRCATTAIGVVRTVASIVSPVYRDNVLSAQAKNFAVRLPASLSGGLIGAAAGDLPTFSPTCFGRGGRYLFTGL